MVLDPAIHSSVQKCVDGLNEGSITCEDGFCIVHSVAKEACYMVYRSDKGGDAVQACFWAKVTYATTAILKLFTRLNPGRTAVAPSVVNVASERPEEEPLPVDDRNCKFFKISDRSGSVRNSVSLGQPIRSRRESFQLVYDYQNSLDMEYDFPDAWCGHDCRISGSMSGSDVHLRHSIESAFDYLPSNIVSDTSAAERRCVIELAHDALAHGISAAQCNSTDFDVGEASTHAFCQSISVADTQGLKRLFIEYDSTLNPGQGNQPLAKERATLLARYLSKWKVAGLELYVLTSSNPEKKVEALQAAELFVFFDGVFSSTLPKKFASKGDFIAARMKESCWRPCEQRLVDDSIEAIQSIWKDMDGTPRPEGPLAHTLRIPQHSRKGLVEEDLKLLSLHTSGAADEATTHMYAFEHDGARCLDDGDSYEKCMIDSLPEDSRAQVLAAAPLESRHEWLVGRPDFAALCRVDAPCASVPLVPVERLQFQPPDRTSPKATALAAKGAVAAGTDQVASKAIASCGVDLDRVDRLVMRLEASAASLVPDVRSKTPTVERLGAADGANDIVSSIDLARFEALVMRLERAANSFAA